MAITVTINAISPSSVDSTQNAFIVYGTFTFSGNYPAGGDIVSFANLDQVRSQQPPIWVDILEMPAAGNIPSGYEYVYAPGTTRDNGKLPILQSGAAVSSPNAQIAAGAYPAAITSAVIGFQAFFPSLI